MYEEELFSSRTCVQCPTPVSPVKRPLLIQCKTQPSCVFLVKYNKRRFLVPELFTIFAKSAKIKLIFAASK
mgnify:FL=1|jgi:hypothetical protein